MCARSQDPGSDSRCKTPTSFRVVTQADGVANVKETANIVPLDWRAYDVEKAIRFHVPFLADRGLLKSNADDLLKSVDLKIYKELSTERER